VAAGFGVEMDVAEATLQTLPLRGGFWRATNISYDVRSCIVTEACVGGEDVDDYCREGHGGPYVGERASRSNTRRANPTAYSNRTHCDWQASRSDAIFV